MTSFVVSTVGVFTFVACNREKMTQPAQQASVAVQDGVLSFDSETTLKATLEALSKNSQPENLDKWEKQWAGFTSMRRAFNSINEEEQSKIAENGLAGYEGFVSLIPDKEDKEAVRNISDPVWATLANRQGLLLVGGTAYVFSYAKISKIANHQRYAKEELLRMARQTNRSTDQVQLFMIQRRKMKTNGQEVNVKNGRVNIAYNNEAVCTQGYWHGGWACCSKRFVGEIEGEGTDNEPFNQDISFTKIIAISKHQRRSSGIWWADAVPKLELNSQATLNFYQGSSVTTETLTTGGTLVNYNQSDLTYTYSTCIGSLCGTTFTISSFTGQHKGTCDDNQLRSCNTDWYN